MGRGKGEERRGERKKVKGERRKEKNKGGKSGTKRIRVKRENGNLEL